jgi:signal transduction histidine kinase
LDFLLGLDPRRVLPLALVMVSGVALLDWRVGPDVTLGTLYLVPVVLAAIAATRVQILLLALVCATLRGFFSTVNSPAEFVLRYLLGFVAYSATGLLIAEILKHHARMRVHVHELREQQKRKQELEEHLRELAESSPAAIFTADEQGCVLTANEETRHLFGLPPGQALRGERAGRFLPVLEGALRLDPQSGVFRTSTECQGRRLNDEPFFAQVWFSLYGGTFGRRLAVIAVDISDEVREREDQNLELLAKHNRIIAGAVSHEVRNICGAINLAVNNLKGSAGPAREAALETLGSLTDALARIASADLAVKTRAPLAPVNLAEVIGQLRVLIEPVWRECGGVVEFALEAELPRVLADPAGLTQVFLNLANNSLRAVRECSVKRLALKVARHGREVHIRFADSGSGIPLEARLFEPFQQQAAGIGLGLYVSRAVLRTYGGDLKHEPSASGCVFCVKLPAA